ncbi:MAG: TRAP transporter large permease, partial [Geminicoccaceae bacterium]|nr:TRAP transporter large permease [Geminicoccaceae bacterium]
AAGGTLGILIPPSIPLVIFGILTETDIAALFMAGIIPGLLLAGLYMFVAWILVARRPELGRPAALMPFGQRLVAFRRTLPVLALFLIVVIGMYTGVFTPTEAAGVGAFASFLLMALRGKATLPEIKAALVETMLTTGAILAVIGAALVFNNFLTISGLTGQLIGWVESLSMSPLGVIFAICLIYLVLGCIFDSLAAMILTAPVFTPIIVSLGYDPVWFGILIVMLCETAMITPPVGVNLFVVQGVRRRGSIQDVMLGVLPFIASLLVMILLVIAWPDIVLWLPRLAGGF